MAKWIKIKVRRRSPEQQKLVDLRIKNENDDFELKNIIINIDNYSIEEYENLIFLEKGIEDGLITNLKFNEENIKILIGNFINCS